MSVVNRPPFRALLTGPGGKDAEGRDLGDDWLIASLGYDDENNGECYVTTDHVHGSDLPAELASAADAARVIARLLNEWVAAGCPEALS